MLKSLTSSSPTFRPVTFQRGLNIVLATRTKASGEKKTVNGLGKTSLVELIHYLLGSNPDSFPPLLSTVLSGYRYSLTFELCHGDVVVTRNPLDPRNIIIEKASEVGWPVKTELSENSLRLLSLDDWRKVLGFCFFDLPSTRETHSPSFRSLIGYFARRQNSGGFLSHKAQNDSQQAWDQQVALMFLLGLNWKLAQQWQKLRDQEKELKALRKAISRDALGEMLGTAAQLRSKTVKLEKEQERLLASISGFQVNESYEDLEKEASRLTEDLLALGDENTTDRQLLEHIHQELESEEEPDFSYVEKLLKEAGILFHIDTSVKLDKLLTYHRSIIRNRKSFLASERVEAEQRIARRTQEVRQLDSRRRDVMKILQESGALRHFNALQMEASARAATLATYRQQYDKLTKLEAGRIELDIERNTLLLRLRQDLVDHGEVVEEAIAVFEGISNKLYESAGTLSVDGTTDGPTFDITIHGIRSPGINNMQIFCFDMMLTILCAKRKLGPGFLIHDSHLFDPVDPRQTATALRVGRDEAERHGFQYIVSMNYNKLESRDFKEFEEGEYIIEPRLTDTDETQSLFGELFE